MKKLLVFLFTAEMLISFTACGQTAPTAATTTAMAEAATTAAAETTAATTAAAETTAAVTEAVTTASATVAATTAVAETTAAAPADDTPVKGLTVAANRFAQHVDWPEMYIWQEFEKDTGIKVTWEYMEGVAIAEQRNLRVATGDLPDAFYGGRWTPAEIAQYTAEGVFVPIEEYLNETYAPNAKKFYDQMPEIWQALYLYDGHIYGFPIINPVSYAQYAIMLRESWMNELNLELPKTTDELFDVLQAMKDAHPDALIYSDYEDQRGYAGLRNALMGSWGLGNRGVANERWDADPTDPAKIRFYPTDERYREMLRLFNRMYEAGMIDPDAATQDEVAWGAKASQEDPAVVGFVTNDTLFAYNAEHMYIGAGCMIGPYGDQTLAGVSNKVARPWNFIITRECKDLPTAIAFADYWMCEEKSELFFHGAEGNHFNWNDDHTMRIQADWIENDPGGRSADQMRSTWTSQPGGSYFGINFPGVTDLTKNYERAVEELSPYLPQIVWPTFSLTLEETAIQTAEGEDIKIHFEESTVAFVNGRLSLDTDWDSYVKKYDDMGLSRLQQVYQNAYGRYIANGGRVN